MSDKQVNNNNNNNNNTSQQQQQQQTTTTTDAELNNLRGLSFRDYLKTELRRGYLLENDEERYTARREKVYTFFKIPREIEKFVAYGFFQCADSFFFVFTFLPIRFTLAIWCLLTRLLRKIVGLYASNRRILKPAEIVDLLKGFMVIVCCYLIGNIDTSVCYHIIKTQSTIKLYLFFNMLEIADRLMSAFGQDTLDALFWTATEPRGRKREHFGVLFHLAIAIIYVTLHSTIVLLQALTLNVAINSDNKGLLTIVISNNFVELKGAVFKKFDRNNLLQISCSDVRERFHNCVLLLVVVIQTMKEYAWREERLWILLPDCLLVCGTEVLVDWLKHAFITRFNDIPADAYRDYTTLLASDLIMCKQKYAYSDHSDLVARRMGFIPLPLGVVMYRILSQSITLTNPTSYLILGTGFLCLLSFRVLNGIIILGKACDLIHSAQTRRVHYQPPPDPNHGTGRTRPKPDPKPDPVGTPDAKHDRHTVPDDCEYHRRICDGDRFQNFGKWGGGERRGRCFHPICVCGGGGERREPHIHPITS
ncbi:hypothetical protein Pmani_037444 [Petrolisthes manimaculis]|uniref:TAPT1-like protein n=1 Tax=Petrolisthes manimaculis TaxID=1843537 RepID=A0AAE1TLH8_9EUCA|nr:hypothetical protein Pmani_037444 [Petrolisthes manimaculis]